MKHIISVIVVIFLALLIVSVINLAVQAAFLIGPFGFSGVVVLAIAYIVYRHRKYRKLAEAMKKLAESYADKIKESIKDDTTVN